MSSFNQAANLLKTNKVEYVDIVAENMVETRTYYNTSANIAFLTNLIVNENVIYKYDPRDYNGLPLWLDITGGSETNGLIVYDPSPDDYTISNVEGGRNISSYEYMEYPLRLISTSRNAPVVIWNTFSAKLLFGSSETYSSSYNKDPDTYGAFGSLRTLIDTSENAQYFRKGLRLFASAKDGNSGFEPLIGTNTYVYPDDRARAKYPELEYIPEYKPFYFFFGPQIYEDAQQSFIDHVEANLKTINNNKKRNNRRSKEQRQKIGQSLAFMNIISALFESQKCNCNAFDEKFEERIEKIADDAQ